MARHVARVNVEWATNPPPNGSDPAPTGVATLEVLMDIRSELRMLNATLGCYRVRRMCDDIN